MTTKQVSARERLFRELISEYSAGLDPGKTELTFGLSPLLVNYSMTTGELTVGAWEYHMWKDPRLSWNPSEHGEVKALRIPARQIWIPDTILYNSVPAVVERDSKIYTVVNSDGTVLWMPRVNYRVLAEEQESGEINGKIKVGCWAYNGNSVVLRQHKPDGFDLSYFDPASRYTIVKSAAKITTTEFEGESYPALEINFSVKARIEG